MDQERMRALMAGARVARLATISADGRAHLVPFVFAFEGDRLFTSVDHKPKRTHRLQRLLNIERDPRVTVLVDHYEEEWPALWWVRVDGRARAIDDPDERARAKQLLSEKYDQYTDDLAGDTFIVIEAERWTGWAFSDP
jgi:PPOX class probable F420-dependent enzyme